MLRIFFGESRRQDSGHLLRAGQAIQAFILTLDKAVQHGKGNKLKLHRFIIRSRGFIDALDELEQSKYCCERYVKQIHKAFVNEMNQDELDAYHRFVYFYKNGFIRIFSILDKLGYLMNEWFELQTEWVKPRFSYFTVLRRMHDGRIHEKLEQQLFGLKVEYKAPLDRLRKQRNMEIHSINSEMLDDLANAEPALPGDRIQVENVKNNVLDLQQGFDGVCRSLIAAFTYMSETMEKK